MQQRLKLLMSCSLACLSVAGVLLVSSLSSSSTSVAQTSDVAWAQQFGTSADDSVTSVTVTSQGEVYVVGWTDGVLPGETGSGARDAFARRYKADGTLVWSHQFGTAGVDVANSADVDSSGALLVGGQVRGTLPGQHPSGPADAFVRKYAADGTEQWTQQFGATGESAVGQVRAVAAAFIFTTGWVYGALPGQKWLGQYDAFVRLFDLSGKELFTRQFGTPQHDRVEAALGDATGGLRLLLGSNPDPSRPNARDTKKDHTLNGFDKSGNRGPTVSAPTSDVDEVSASTLMGTGEAILVGQLNEHGHAFVRKLNAAGKDEWTTHVQVSDIDTAVATATDASGAVYVAGNMATPAAASTDLTHIWVQKYSASGSLVWTRQVGTSGKDVVTSLAVSPGGTVYLAGWTRGTMPGQTNAGRSDAFVAKLI